ncbi:TetR/AcrR family transcriptional regulator [Streptomyces fractus]|uniref:TetR/AcrR family transcriptional regulator n=1 Tax=Streptomyces fractus TaxID=641806 RepID=UPI003CF2BA94
MTAPQNVRPSPGRTTPPRRQTARCDAEDNRCRIIETARTVFAGTPEASLQSIAKAAGVGQGTLYRNFPHREALLLAVYANDVETLIDAAPLLLADREPMAALRSWLGRLAAYGGNGHPASQAVEAATRADVGDRHYRLMAAALDQILAACHDTEQIRPDARAEEILLLVSFLWKSDSAPDAQQRTERLLSIVTDGLRAPAPRGAGA